MAEVSTIAAAPRERVGKGAARAARRDGLVPGMIYGNKLEPVMISLDRPIVDRELGQPGFFIRLVDIEVGGEKHRVLPREVQFHPVSDAPLHIDFLRFSASRKLAVAVPVRFLNEDESPGLKRGGVLNVVRHEVEVQCTADNIPGEFEVDVTGLEIGDAIHASAIILPEGVAFTIADRDFTVATIAAPTLMAADEEEEEVEGEEGEEGAEADGEGAGEGSGDATPSGDGE
ncbi:MAG: 50S ribosomal protein L25/general stress protein Ctc [Defluviicoccus sp.]|nr:50S ribosomal protein L25/general stress protein Ctc [Defluviicoccus sp.]